MDWTKAKANAAGLVSLLLAVLTAASALTLPDNVRGWVGGALAVLTAAGTWLATWQTPNKPIIDGQPHDGAYTITAVPPPQV